MFASEDYTEAHDNGKRWGCGESGVYETWTDNIGKLFLGYQREHGRCMGHVYVDQIDKPVKVGWVFRKRRKFSDCNETYLAETWVTLYSTMPERTVKYNYHTL